ncbi:MAG: ABC transporter ATP-binding protein [Bacteroidales bacterium]|nr:ABC transporter ATP-binding protein [Bacteroidales bacterium]MCB8998645.1 ABC transporter ATP-binding protein [Bacteroidales bacterium]
MPDKELVLQVKNLSKSYRSIKAISNLSIEVGRGKVYGILGPNGSGKTTTLSILTGILEQDSGSFSWFGEEPSAATRKRIGSMIETPAFFPYMSLENNLRIVAQIKECGFDDIPEVLKAVKLYDRRKSRFSTLSLGMKQRLGIAATLVGNPEILVLDEPTNGLDPEGIAEVRELIIQQAAAGKTIIMASHILSEVEKVCDEVAILKNGILLSQGDVRALIKGESILEIKAANTSLLIEVMKDCPFIAKTEKENSGLTIILKEGFAPEDLNRYAFEKGLVLSEIIVRQKSLETQFLQLVKE